MELQKLTDLCLSAIRNGLESGRITELAGVSPGFRHRILDMILTHESIDKPNCQIALSTPGFLQGVTRIDTQNGKINDFEYLDRVATGLSAILPNGETIGSGVQEIRLNIFGRKVVAFNLRSVVRVIEQCRNLRSLSLRVVGLDKDRKRKCENSLPISRMFSEEILGQSLGIIGNVIEFLLIGSECSIKLETPLPVFRQLTLLTLKSTSLNNHTYWYELEERICCTIVHLHLDKLFLKNPPGPVPILQRPFPQLKTLTYKPSLRESSKSIDLYYPMLLKCPMLEQVELSLRGMHVDDIEMSILHQLTRLPLKVRLILDHLDGAGQFKLINILGDKITHLAFRCIWTDHFTVALEEAIGVCHNLVSIDFRPIINPFEEDMMNAAIRGWEKAMAALRSLFSTQERALKLEKVSLRSVDIGVLNVLFENCLHLNSLVLDGCPELVDDHLIQWASHGARLSNLSLECCDNITENGLIPIMISSGRNLISLGFDTATLEGHPQASSDAIWQALDVHCPNLTTITGLETPSAHIVLKFPCAMPE